MSLKILLAGLQGYSMADFVNLPIGLMYLTSYIKKHIPDCEIKVVNSFVDFESEEELLDIIREFRPDIVGIRGISMYLDDLLKYAEDIRNDPALNCLLVAGGPVTSTDTEVLIDSGTFNHIVIGDGEEVFLDIVRSYIGAREAGEDPLRHRSDVRRGYIEDLNKLPFPDYSVIDFKRYERFMGIYSNRSKYGSIFSSRGCPYHCIYCHNIFGKRARLRDSENVLDEIRHLYYDYDIRDFCIIDDIFNIDYDRAIRIFQGVIDEGMKVKFSFPNGIRGDIIDERFIDTMVEAGSIFVAVSVETASPRVQRMIKKNVNLEKIKRNIQYLSTKDIIVHVFFMLGFPTETLEDAITTFKFVESLGTKVMPILSYVRYYEKAELYDIAKANGFTDEMLSDSRESFSHDSSNFRTPTLSNRDIKRLGRYFIFNIVEKRERIEHILKMLRLYYDEERIMEYLNYYHPYIKSDSVPEFMEKVALINRIYGKAKSMDEYFNVSAP